MLELLLKFLFIFKEFWKNRKIKVSKAIKNGDIITFFTVEDSQKFKKI